MFLGVESEPTRPPIGVIGANSRAFSHASVTKGVLKYLRVRRKWIVNVISCARMWRHLLAIAPAFLWAGEDGEGHSRKGLPITAIFVDVEVCRSADDSGNPCRKVYLR